MGNHAEAADMAYEGQRSFVLQQARTMIEATGYSPWSICMQHEDTETARVARQCMQAGRQLAACLSQTLRRIEQGEPLAAICDLQALSVYQKHDYPKTAAGGAASALDDAALLIVTIDPTPFASQVGGDLSRDAHSYLNSTLHVWLLQLQRQWKILQADQPTLHSAIFDAPLPPPEKEKATLKTAWRALCHSLHIGAERPSPYESAAAPEFARQFPVKLWPRMESDGHLAPLDGCTVATLSSDFQHWYYSVGKTQLEVPTPAAAREAETVFLALRDQLHEHSRSCSLSGRQQCQGSCVSKVFDAVGDSPFKQRCRSAVDYILLHKPKL